MQLIALDRKFEPGWIGLQPSCNQVTSGLQWVALFRPRWLDLQPSFNWLRVGRSGLRFLGPRWSDLQPSCDRVMRVAVGYVLGAEVVQEGRVGLAWEMLSLLKVLKMLIC